MDSLNASSRRAGKGGDTDKDVEDMLHKATYQVSPEKKQEELDNVTIAANAREIQYTSMLDSDHMKLIMREVIDLNAEVTGIASDLAFVEDKSLQTKVEFANTAYVRLFERMLSETLMLQRSKFKSQTKTIQELRALLAELTVKEQAAREAGMRDRNSSQQIQIEMAALQRQILLLGQQIEELTLAKLFLEDQNKSLSVKLEGYSGGMSDKDRQLLINQTRSEARAAFMRELAQLKKQWAKENEAKLRDLQEKMKGMSAAPSMAELTKSGDADTGFKRPLVAVETQTEVDENGLWDKQDGWTLPISGTIIARKRWKKAIEFSKCPSCHGIGQFVALAAKLLTAMQRGGGSQLVDENRKPMGKTGAVWQIPDGLVRFMSNLPRTVMAISPKPLAWCVRRVWYLLAEKFKADETDETQGLPIQEVEEHMIEAFLIRSEKRSDAELDLYVLLATLKEHYQKHMLLHTYARFIGVLDGWTAAEIKRLADEKQEAKDKKREKEKAAKYKKMSARDRTNAARADEDAERAKLEREQGKAVVELKLPVCDASLSLPILRVYHFARHCLLESYQGGYAPMILRIKAQNDHLVQNAIRLQKEQEMWKMSIPDHVCVDPKYQFYLPLDRALRVTQAVICFLEEAEYNSALRALEHAVVFLNPDGTLGLPEGMHTLIRSTVREFLSCENTDGADMTFMDVYSDQMAQGKLGTRDPEKGPMTEEELQEGKMITLVNMDTCLRIMCECLMRRVEYVEGCLADIFIEGDTNKDGVLSFGEFMAIVGKVAPHFTDRRSLRMYREALSMGNDDDTIGSVPFVQVCKKHGLLSLVDMQDMRQGSLKALCKTQEEKERDNRLLEEQRARAMALAQKAASSMFSQGGFRTPADRVAARRNSVLQTSSKKAPSMAGMIGNIPAGGRAPSAVNVDTAAAAAPTGLKNNMLASLQEHNLSPAAKLLKSKSAKANLGSPAAAAGPALSGLQSKLNSMHDSGSESESSVGSPTAAHIALQGIQAPASPISTMRPRQENSTANNSNIGGSDSSAPPPTELQRDLRHMVASGMIKEHIAEEGEHDSDADSEDESRGIIARKKAAVLKQQQQKQKQQQKQQQHPAPMEAFSPPKQQLQGQGPMHSKARVDAALGSLSAPAGSIADLLNSLEEPAAGSGSGSGSDGAGGDSLLMSKTAGTGGTVTSKEGSPVYARNSNINAIKMTDEDEDDESIGSLQSAASEASHALAENYSSFTAHQQQQQQQQQQQASFEVSAGSGESRNNSSAPGETAAVTQSIRRNFQAKDIKTQLALRRDQRLQEKLKQEADMTKKLANSFSF